MPAGACSGVLPFGTRPGIGNVGPVSGGSGTRLALGCSMLLARLPWSFEGAAKWPTACRNCAH